MSKVTIDNLAAEIALSVQEYTVEVAEEVEEIVLETANDLVAELKEVSPKDTGKYARGWTKFKSISWDGPLYTIYNRTRGWLAHMLEFGHAKVNGGRVDGKPHIIPTYNKHVARMEKRIERVIKRGGKA